MVDYPERCCDLCLRHHGNSWLCLLGRYTREQKPRLWLVRLEIWPQELALQPVYSARKLPSWVETARKLLGQSSGERKDGGARNDCHQHLPDQLSKCGKDLGKCQRGGQNDAPSPWKPSRHREHTMPDTPLPFVLELWKAWLAGSIKL